MIPPVKSHLEEVLCPQCNGSGEGVTERHRCPDCGGSGTVIEEVEEYDEDEEA